MADLDAELAAFAAELGDDTIAADTVVPNQPAAAPATHAPAPLIQPPHILSAAPVLVRADSFCTLFLSHTEVSSVYGNM